MIAAMLGILRRELRLAARSKAAWLMPPLFYAVVVTLFALGSEPNDPQLARFAPAILWVGALLSSLLTLERLFRADFEDGTLEQMFVSPLPPVLGVTLKLLAHWLLSGLPMLLLCLPLASALGLDSKVMPVLLAGLASGTGLLTLIGGFAAALTVGLPRAGALLPILVLPLLTPVLIFGAGAVRAAQTGLDAAAPLYFLAALLVLCLTLIPWAATAALRNAFE